MSKIMLLKHGIADTLFCLLCWGNIIQFTHATFLQAVALLVLLLGLTWAYVWYVVRQAARRFSAQLQRLQNSDFLAVLDQLKK